MERKTILIDIDDTILHDYELPFINKFLGTTHTYADFEYPGAYVQDIFKDYPATKKEEFYDFFFTQDMYGDSIIKIKPDAIEVIKKLCERHDVYFCSDFTIWQRPWQSDKAFVDKFQMLKRHFPFLSPFQHIYIKKKCLLHADVLIDDRPYNFGPHIKQKLLFTTYHNKNLPEQELAEKKLIRINSWAEIAKLLL